MSITIHQQENNIFKEYIAELHESLAVVQDGLHYLGDLQYSNDTNCWGRKPGNEENLWQQICGKKRGLVVITKDINDDSAWDIRMEHGLKNGCKKKVPTNHLFYRRLRTWIYGLLSIGPDGKMPKFPEVDMAQDLFENSPWVRVNLKKALGYGSISNKELQSYINRFKPLLLRQLQLYKEASIYLDCTRKNGIGLLKELYDDLKPFIPGDSKTTGEDEWIFYSENHRFIVVNSYHPSFRCSNEKEIEYYNNMKEAVEQFFKEYPNFFG